MADVKICDRCGVAIKANTAQSLGFGAWRYTLCSRGTSQCSYYDYDLCVSCGDKLSKFLKGEDLADIEEVTNGT